MKKRLIESSEASSGGKAHSVRKDASSRELSATTVNRLPKYYRKLKELLINDIKRISSAELAGHMNITAAQVRADLSGFGGLGQQGYGYNVKLLFTEISAVLGAGNSYNAVIIGSTLALAFSSQALFKGRGVIIRAFFTDGDPGNGEDTDGIPVYDMSRLEEVCRDGKIDLAVILPIGSGDINLLGERLENCGVSGIINLTSSDIVNRSIPVKNVSPGDTLMTLCYEIRKNQMEKQSRLE